MFANLLAWPADVKFHCEQLHDCSGAWRVVYMQSLPDTKQTFAQVPHAAYPCLNSSNCWKEMFKQRHIPADVY